ncbi:hypothetical protein ABZ942_36650 [Nocardia sp. NPDC046473]|uniref:hypothetical protein n=1 Tax=Nocardia sp. NPDC046473 TaxID=3155733 RepID=UPI0033D50A65
MSTRPLTASDAAHWAARAGLELPVERHAGLATTAEHIHSVVAILRELDFADAAPAAVYRAKEDHDETV